MLGRIYRKGEVATARSRGHGLRAAAQHAEPHGLPAALPHAASPAAIEAAALPVRAGPQAGVPAAVSAAAHARPAGVSGAVAPLAASAALLMRCRVRLAVTDLLPCCGEAAPSLFMTTGWRSGCALAADAGPFIGCASGRAHYGWCSPDGPGDALVGCCG